MARANKRTSALLGALAVVFIVIIIILCIVPKGGSPSDKSTQEQQKSKDITDVITDTTTTPTTSTTPEPPIATTSATTTPEPITTTTTTTAATTPDITTLLTTIAATTPEQTTTISTTADEQSTTISTTTDEPATVLATNATTTPEPTAPPTTTATITSEEATVSTDSTTTTIPESTTLLTDNTTTTTSEPTTLLTDTSNTTTTQPTTVIFTTTTTTDSTDSTSTTLESVTEKSTTDSMSTSEMTTSQTTTRDTSSPTPTPPSTTTSVPTTTVTKETTTMTTAEMTETGSSTTTSMPPASSSCQANQTCNTPACKMTAANMLAMMDHREEADPCQDFYQYACGGMMENLFLGAKNPGVIAENLIRDQLETTDSDNTTNMGNMRIFYDKCLNAVDQDVKESWNQTLKEVFGQHRFDDPSPIDLTRMLMDMMAYDFTPFFDMSMDVKRDDSDAFSLTLHPTVPSSAFSEDLARKVCLEEHHKRLEVEDSYDVAEEYQTFTECVHKGTGLEARLERMEEAVQRFGLLDHLGKDGHRILQDSKNKARSFLQELAEALPNVPELKEDLRNKNNNPVSVTDLDSEVVIWMQLIQHFVPKVASTEKVLTYKMDDLLGMLEVLKKYNDTDHKSLRNVLLMMWSEKLYTDFVKPVGGNVGEHKYCLHAAITLMPEAASELYLDALSPEEVEARNAQTNETKASIKRAGKKELTGMAQDSVKKLEDMLDNVIQDVSSDTGRLLPELKTSGFFDNCIQLLKQRRAHTYEMYEDMPVDVPLWFMQPYNPFGRHIYAMSRITIPYAAQEDSSTFKNLPKYMSYAGIGHMISHLVMHGYDTSGVVYQEKGKDNLENQAQYTSKTENLRRQYTAAQSYVSKGITANITMSTLAFNELLADSGATKLAWEAYLMRNEVDPTTGPPITVTDSQAARRRRSPQDMTGRTKRASTSPLPPIDTEERPLPWLGLTPIQLYFLHWSQRQCSASGGMGLLELMESEQPPARMRVNLVLQNEPLFNEAFNCQPKSKESPFVLG